MSKSPRTAPHQYLVRGYERTTWDKVLDGARSWRSWIVVTIIAALVLDHVEVITLPVISDLHKLLILGVIGGYLGGKVAVWPTIEDRVRGDRVDIAITPVEGDILDIISIPQDDFWGLDVVGGLKERFGIAGGLRFVARGIDLERGLLVSAGDRPSDSEVPDDVQLIGSGADEMYHKLRGEVLDEYRAGTNRARDRQIMMEEASRQVSNDFAELFESIRAGDIDVRDLNQTEAEQRADALIRNLAITEGADSPGDSDE